MQSGYHKIGPAGNSINNNGVSLLFYTTRTFSCADIGYDRRHNFKAFVRRMYAVKYHGKRSAWCPGQIYRLINRLFIIPRIY